MLLRGITLGCCLALGLVAGCQKASPVAEAPPEDLSVPTQAQPRLPTLKLWLGQQELITEIASSSKQMQTGMMFREQMQENEAMLFVFTQPHQASFYMKNTILPLSCAYIDNEGTILEIYDMKPLDESSIQAKSSQIQYVLETRQGWFERNKVGIGTMVRTEKGSLQETFFRKR